MGTNSRANRKAEKAFEGYSQKVGETLISADSRFEALDENDCTVMAIRIRFPGHEKDDFLVTTKAAIEGKQMVAFHGADTFQEALVGTLNRLYNKSMQWKEDQYAE